MGNCYQFEDIGRVPLPGDNVGIATRQLDAGSEVVYEGRSFILDFTVMEGHRFALQTIAVGAPVLSWGLPFGVALRPIEAGNYLHNIGMLEALRGRSIDFALPTEPNFADRVEVYEVNEAEFRPAEQVPPHDHERTFMGYRRGGERGVGTRNTIILLGTNSHTSGYVRQLETRLAGLADRWENVDGIVAVAHTEGDKKDPNNLDLLLRTLAGFMVHPNVGAVLAVDYGGESVTNEMLEAYMVAHGYALESLPHRFLTLMGSFQENLAQGEAIVREWLPLVDEMPRTAESVANLKIALQCGGSDAFSGISGNPLASWVAKEVIRYGGAANLAETDELIGAEPYALQKVKDIETAKKFLATVARFKEWTAWHGHSADGNPSGGNKFRGLYNIVLKSIGAAMKRHPDVRLDHVIDYSEPMVEPGYYFMDSPGNDLESIAGQVAAGCNMIFFVTGNGSITNFPFVPTLKIVTTSQRYALLSEDMDVNAGAYLDGRPMDAVGAKMFEETLDVASGRQSVGERAGHAQVQLWRNWHQTDGRNLAQLLQRGQPSGEPIPLVEMGESISLPPIQFQAVQTEAGLATDQVGLILPTSLCSGQIARMAARRLNNKALGREQNLSRFVSLVHTEGCGSSSGESEILHARTMMGYINHPSVRYCLLLEHGCEKTHNDYMRNHAIASGIDTSRLGWASVQLDGGIVKAMQKMEDWFANALAQSDVAQFKSASLESLRLALLSAGPVTDPVAMGFARLTQAVVKAGGTIVVPENTGLLASALYRAQTIGEDITKPSLAYGQAMPKAGFHIMETPTEHWAETLSGLGATGVEAMVSYVTEHPMQSHPMIPVLQVTAEASVEQHFRDDVDLIFGADSSQWAGEVLQLVADVHAHQYTPKLYQQGNIDFQVTRGVLGVSL